MRARTLAFCCAPAALAGLLACVCAFAAEEPPPSPGQAPSAAAAAEEAPEPAPDLLPAVARFRFAGNEHFSSRSLRREMETQTRKPIELKTLQADVNHIIARYTDDGYLEATIDNPLIQPIEGKSGKELLITIKEGRRFTLKKLEIVGNTVFPTEELRALVTPEREGYFTKGGFLEGARRIWEHYGKAGRLTTVVEPQMGPRPATPDATVRYLIKEGPPVTLQAFSFQWVNTPVTAEWLVLREADRTLTEGEPLTLAQIEEVVGRLTQARWFKSVHYEIKPGDAPDRVLLVFRLEEGWTSRMSLTGTAATYFGFSGALQFAETDFDIASPPHSWQDIEDGNMFRGRGERLVLTLSPGQRLTTISGVFEQPYTFGTNNTLGVSGQYRRADWTDYREWQWQLRAGLTRELSEHWSAGFGPTVQGTEMWNLSRHDVPDYNDAAGYTPGYGAWGRLAYATTPPGIIVNRGVRAALTVEPMYEDATILGTGLSASRFFPLHGEGLHAHVLELAASAGYLAGNAPVFDRLYCGGLGSVRGFGPRGISPLFEDTPIGGYFSGTATAEYSFPLFHVYDEAFFRGALFVDAGDAETRLGDMGRIRAASGVGLRIVLPKLRGVTAGVNFAWPINSYPGDDTQVFTFFISAGL